MNISHLSSCFRKYEKPNELILFKNLKEIMHPTDVLVELA